MIFQSSKIFWDHKSKKPRHDNRASCLDTVWLHIILKTNQKNLFGCVGDTPPPLARIKCHTPLDSVTGFGFMVPLVKVQKYNEQIIYTVYTLACINFVYNNYIIRFLLLDWLTLYTFFIHIYYKYYLYNVKFWKKKQIVK